MQILTLNAGSSSIKAKLFELDASAALVVKTAAQISGLGSGNLLISCDDLEQRIQVSESPYEVGFTHLINHFSDQIDERQLVIGHRVVHGGERFFEPTLIDNQVLSQLHQLAPLAPLHEPHNLKLIELCRKRFAQVPNFACFDTGFHASQPKLETSYALPESLRQLGIRRYGFHGLSYHYLSDYLDLGDDSRAIALHLGSGASACALKGGQSIATSMGFSALDGLPMGTRSGQIDPGVLLYLAQQLNWDNKQIETLLYNQSGLLGLSGESPDMRKLRDSQSNRAQFAIQLFSYRIAAEIGRLTAILGGVEKIIFTGGIGENDPQTRADIIERTAWLGAKLDPARNIANAELISADDSAINLYRIATDEELQLAKLIRQQL